MFNQNEEREYYKNKLTYSGFVEHVFLYVKSSVNGHTLKE